VGRAVEELEDTDSPREEDHQEQDISLKILK